MKMLKLSLKEFLKAKKIDAHFKRLKAFIIFRQSKEVYGEININYERSTINNPNSYGKLIKVPYEHQCPYPLKLVVNDFLYANTEHKDYIVIRKILEEQGSFLISGRKITQKITFMK